MRGAFQAEGELGSIDLLAALCAVGREGSTARVVFTREAETVVFVIEGGLLADLQAPADCSASEVLIRSGKLQRETYDALVVPSGQDRFSVATSSGVVSRKEAAWGWKLSAIESLAHLLSWTDGSYAFEPLAPESPGSFRIPVDKWILELFLRSNDRVLVMSRIGPTDLPLVKAGDFASSFGALGLTADADTVASLVDGERTVEEIVRHARADEFAVLKLLAALISLGLVLPAYESPFPASSGTETQLAAPALETEPEPASFETEAFDLPAAREEEPPPSPDPIAIPLFALTAPEEPVLPPEPDAAEPAPAPPRRRSLAGVWITLLLAAAGAAAYWLLSNRTRSIPVPGTANRAAAVAKAEPPPGKRDLAPEPAQRRPAVAVIPAAPERKASAPSKAQGSSSAWKAELDRERRAFDHSGEFAYAIQLELACQDATVEKALRADPSRRRIWVVPFAFRGRDCYRVLWGKYKTLALAKAAKPSVPAIFLRGGNRPAVIALPGAGKPSGKR
ncbi:MAG: DUF4388 domain-containing protein [Thermoanaerobaculia bacterium]